MKDFKQAAEETKKRLGVDLFFICDKLPGACRGAPMNEKALEILSKRGMNQNE